MSRTYRMKRNARISALLGLLFLVLCAAGCVWATVASRCGSGFGFPLIVFAAVALCLAIHNIRECMRIVRLLEEEAYWNNIRAIRPKL